MRKNSSGFAQILVVVLLVIGLASLGLYFTTSRRGQSIFPPSTPSSPSPTSTIDPTANWKTYNNNKYGFAFKYPQDMFIEREGINESSVSYWQETVRGLRNRYVYTVTLSENKYRGKEFRYPSMTVFIFETRYDLASWLKWNGDSTCDLGIGTTKKLYPCVSNKVEVLVGNNQAIKFETSTSTSWSTRTLVLIKNVRFFNNDTLLDITHTGIPKETYDQILSTFKFLE